MKRIPWTHEELQAMIPKVAAELQEIESQQPGIKPIPPLAKQECMEYLYGLLDIASRRALTKEECCLLCQLMAQFEQAILAERLGKKGRFYVIPEDEIMKLARK